ncbi:hypothetical protein KP509_30G074100 [Ceratopteris richardii]|uniref:Cytochrome b561 domain-containing protein n=1 Tax=Ceratopteris richardii TaxID=49495 RepID=A0A8T2R5J2_CERRI|nr:hypothetical protein KP509_30G074100 [Ceratopteris richardii]
MPMRTNLHRLHVESSAKAPLKSGSKGGRRWPQQSWRPSLNALLLWAHCMGLICAVFTFAWVIRFRGGLPFIAHGAILADRSDLIFNVHPVLMVVGYIILVSEAILVFRGVSGTKSYKKAIHLTIQAVGFWMAVFGIWAALLFHNAKGIDNFYSLHSWLGIVTVSLFGLQV